MSNVLKSSKISNLYQNLKFLYRYKKRLKKAKAKGRIGWHKQQLVKLAAHDLIRSTHYMTLDADVVCIRKFSLKDVILQGKALAQAEQIGDYVDLYHPFYAAVEYQVKANRYFLAFKMLQFDRPAEYKYRIYSETPVIMNTKGVSMMTQYIENKFELGWRKYLLENFDLWIEPALYFLFLEGTDLFDQMYLVTPEKKLWDLSKSLWLREYYYREKRALDNIDEYLNDVKGYFIVLQTGWGVRSGIFFEKIAQKIKEL
ncbi:MAG: hypothetical protein EHM85_08210 [Desulfobacteraceae bacterium]|nr:MAG: hypothetical protein EHM85_08210 [Desulfobacteraceae bacterium]